MQGLLDGMSSVALQSLHLRFALGTLQTATQEINTAGYKEMLVQSQRMQRNACSGCEIRVHVLK